jgi:DNA-binding transcriptional ArsR family regulator
MGSGLHELGRAGPRPAISKHLKVLERAGLVSRGRDVQRRPVKLEDSEEEEALNLDRTRRLTCLVN